MLGPSTNVTNLNDPQSVRCRLFVGNLNTVQMSKQELEQAFAKYGFISGVSMHKGFAFVQFTNELSARLAAVGEDQKVYYNMRVDVNIASEPKDRRRNHNGSNSSSGGSTKRPRIDSHTRSSTSPVGGPRMSNLVSLVSPSFPNTGSSQNADKVLGTQPASSASPNPVSISPITVIPVVRERVATVTDRQTPTRKPVGKEVKDYLICGVCKAAFDQVDKLMTHKSEGCRLRFSCRCKATDQPETLQCAYCLNQLSSAWELIKHCQAEHELTIFALDSSHSEELSSQDKGNRHDHSIVNSDHSKIIDHDHELVTEKLIEEPCNHRLGRSRHSSRRHRGDADEEDEDESEEDDDDDVSNVR